MSIALSAEEALRRVARRFDGVVEMERWGERSLFYNPDFLLPHGVYFVTIKEHDGPNDKASRLDRDGVYRVSLGIGRTMYTDHFGPTPTRPSKGQIVDTGHDFTALDTLTPHPVYGWMGWVCVLSPTAETLSEMGTLIAEAHRLAVDKFDKRLRKSKRDSKL